MSWRDWRNHREFAAWRLGLPSEYGGDEDA